MKKLNLALMSAGMALMPAFAQAFTSGSTGADGAFSPTVNTQVVLPSSGILNYTTVNIPAGVTVTFQKNATNTPVVILASGNVTIGGTILLVGSDAKASGAAGDGVLGDDGIPGVGGPGGYDGGRGGIGAAVSGGASGLGGTGLGPGGGGGGRISTYSSSYYLGGAGGGFGASGGYGWPGSANYGAANPGASYGTSQLLPMIGGSGGGGGVGGSVFTGSGGGGGGGALLIASSGTVSVNGSINASGGAGATSGGVGCGGGGGGGSGGAIRIVATTIQGNGSLAANGGGASGSCTGGTGTEYGGAGGAGRIRLEAEIYTRTATSSPAHTQATVPGSVFVAGLPTLSITSVGGTAVPAQPTGNADVTLPSTTANPVAVVFTTTGVPAGNTVKLTLVPASGAVVTAVSPALVGDTTSATASVNISLPNGPSTLQATVTYNIVLAMGEALSVYAQGERVEKITLASTLGSRESKVTLITVSGKEFVVPASVLAAMPA